MFDRRWSELAEILVNYSTRTRPGDRLLISMMEPETFPLTLAVYEEAVRAGAFPQVQFTSAYLERALLRYGSDDLVARVPDLELQGMEWADVYVGLRGARNPHELAGISPERLAAHKRAMGAVSARRTERTRWVPTWVPNEAFAQQAGMSLGEMMRFYFNATLRDWEAEARRYAAIRDRFQRATRVRISGRDTDLTFTTAGRTYLAGDVLSATTIRAPLRLLTAVAGATSCLLLGAAFALLLPLPATIALIAGATVLSFVSYNSLTTLMTRETPGEAGTTMVLNGSVINFGTAVGAAVGGFLIALSGYALLGLLVIVFVLGASALVLLVRPCDPADEAG